MSEIIYFALLYFASEAKIIGERPLILPGMTGFVTDLAGRHRKIYKPGQDELSCLFSMFIKHKLLAIITIVVSDPFTHYIDYKHVCR